MGPSEQFLKERRDFGVSLYDRHRDGSGSCYSSWLRPILNTRPKRAIWNFNADLHITDWLQAIGQPYDIITDDRIHVEGVELLQKSEDGDFLRSVAEAVLQLLMEADVEGLIGAGRTETAVVS